MAGRRKRRRGAGGGRAGGTWGEGAGWSYTLACSPPIVQVAARARAHTRTHPSSHSIRSPSASHPLLTRLPSSPTLTHPHPPPLPRAVLAKAQLSLKQAFGFDLVNKRKYDKKKGEEVGTDVFYLVNRLAPQGGTMMDGRPEAAKMACDEVRRR